MTASTPTHTSTANNLDATANAEVESRHARLKHSIEHSAHLLPAQGPITVFIHHNTLHAFEDLSFDEGVQQGAKVFGQHSPLTLSQAIELCRFKWTILHLPLTVALGHEA